MKTDQLKKSKFLYYFEERKKGEEKERGEEKEGGKQNKTKQNKTFMSQAIQQESLKSDHLKITSLKCIKHNPLAYFRIFIFCVFPIFCGSEEVSQEEKGEGGGDNNWRPGIEPGTSALENQRKCHKNNSNNNK